MYSDISNEAVISKYEKMKNWIKTLFEFRFVKTVNVLYQYQNVNDREGRAFEDGSTVFIERCFAMDLPKRDEAIIWKGHYFRVATIWHNKDENCIEVDLNDL